MSALPAYDYAERAYEQRRAREQRPQISVVRGQGARTAERSLDPAVIAVAKIAVVAFILFAVIGIARVAISAVTVTTSIESQQLSGQISDARTEGNDLEVAQSMLSNPTRIKVEATALGMGAAADVEKIDLSGDVVVTDDVGNLSLSGSVAAAAL